MNLEVFGWSSFFAEAFRQYEPLGYQAGRVSFSSRGKYLLQTESGELEAEMSGRLLHAAAGPDDWPAVGDWVVVRPATNLIDAILPRKTRFSRKRPGELTEEQVLAANIDVLFLVNGLDGDFNPRRIERYLLLARESGARPVIALNKADVCPDPAGTVREVRAISAGAPVVLMSAVRSEGLDSLDEHITPGETAALAGSSGVGKSTIVNRLRGFEVQAVGAVREPDSKGRHTTSHRELILMPAGWLFIDMPGLREVQLWAGHASMGEAFPDIAGLAARCRFRDCQHQGEPGCAVTRAIEEEGLDADRLRSYAKLQRELDHLDRKADQHAAAEERRRIRRLHREYRKVPNRW